LIGCTDSWSEVVEEMVSNTSRSAVEKQSARIMHTPGYVLRIDARVSKRVDACVHALGDWAAITVHVMSFRDHVRSAQQQRHRTPLHTLPMPARTHSPADGCVCHGNGERCQHARASATRVKRESARGVVRGAAREAASVTYKKMGEVSKEKVFHSGCPHGHGHSSR
jgi:hypothetical protein